MNDLKKMAKNTVIYLLGTVFSKGISFFLLPMYTKYLTPEEFGQYDLGLAYATLFWTFVYLDIYSSILRFMYDFTDKKSQRKPMINGLIIFFGSTIVYGLILVLWNLFFENSIQYSALLFVVGVCTILQEIVGHIARGFGKNRLFVTGGMIGAIVTFLANIMFLIVFATDFSGIYLATIIGLLANIIYVGGRIGLLKEISFTYYDSKLFKEIFTYSIPLSVNSVSYWFLNNFNRVAVSNMLSLYDNGLYAITLKFGALVNLFTSGFQLAWQELIFSKHNQTKEEMSRFYTIAINSYILFLLFGITISLPFIKLFLPILVDQSFIAGAHLIPMALLAAVSSSSSSFIGNIFSTLKQTKSLFTTTILGAIVNVTIVALLIPIIGVQAANIAVILGFSTTVYRRIMLLRKFADLTIYWNKLIYGLLFFAMAYYGFAQGSLIINFAILFMVMGLNLVLYRKIMEPFIKRVLSKDK